MSAQARSLILGRRFDQRPLKVEWPMGHTLISGITGSGKSTTMNAIIAQLAAWSCIALFGVDLKLTELAPWNRRFTYVARSHAEADSLVAWVLQIIDYRQDILVGAGLRDWHTGLGPWIVVVIDEAAEFFGLSTHEVNQLIAGGSVDELLADPETKKQISARLSEAKTAKEIRSANLETMARTARALGIRILLATQYPTAAIIGTQVRAQIDYILMHRVDRTEHVDVSLGEGMSKTIPPDSIAHDEPGAFYYKAPSTRPVKAKGPLFTDAQIFERAAATAHLRWDLAHLQAPAELAGAEVAY